MTILITGTSGFIGGRLLPRLVERFGKDGVAALSSRPIADGRSLRYAPDTFDVAAADVPRLDAVETLILAGAFTPKSGAEANHVALSGGNIRSTEAILSHAWPSLRRIVYLSTLDVYAPAPNLSERSATEPETLYGWSKLYGEKVVSAFAKQRGIEATVLRIGHVYGPGEEKYAKFLPRAVQNVVNGDPVELWGTGEDLRSLIYIDDVVAAVIKSLEVEGLPGVINVVGGHPRSLKAILAALEQACGHPIEIRQMPSTAPRKDFVFDTELLRAHLLPVETDFVDGLRAELAHMAGKASA